MSIIVPVYNVSAWIGRCLDSIEAQTYESLEVLFIDDCGQDDSIEMIRKRIERWPKGMGRIILHEHNKGLSGARNTGLREAKGEYVYFLDSDDAVIAKGFRFYDWRQR